MLDYFVILFSNINNPFAIYKYVLTTICIIIVKF